MGCDVWRAVERQREISLDAGMLSIALRDQGWGVIPITPSDLDRRGGVLLVCQVQKCAEGSQDRRRVTGRCGRNRWLTGAYPLATASGDVGSVT